jgi:hypothetical protein
MLEAHLALPGVAGSEMTVELTVAERDPVDPLDRSLRASIMARVLERSGFRIDPADVAIRGIDPLAIVGRRAAT